MRPSLVVQVFIFICPVLTQIRGFASTLTNSRPLGLCVCLCKPGFSKAPSASANGWLGVINPCHSSLLHGPMVCSLHASPRSDTPLPGQRLVLTLESLCLLGYQGSVIAGHHGSQQLLTKPAVTAQVCIYMLYHTFFYCFFYSVMHPERNFNCLSVH